VDNSRHSKESKTEQGCLNGKDHLTTANFVLESSVTSLNKQEKLAFANFFHREITSWICLQVYHPHHPHAAIAVY